MPGPSKARVYGIYKKKTEKVQPVNSSNSDGSTPGGNKNWRERAIQKERYTVEMGAKYTDLLIPKFSGLAKGSRLTLEQLQKMIVGKAMTLQEKELHTEMLYTHEAAIAWDFTEMEKVKSEVAPPQKIRSSSLVSPKFSDSASFISCHHGHVTRTSQDGY